MRTNKGNGGFTLMEVVFGLLILSLAALMVARTGSFLSRQQVDMDQKRRALERCQSLMAEVKTAVARNFNQVNSLEDGPGYSDKMSLAIVAGQDHWTRRRQEFVPGMYGGFSIEQRDYLRRINFFTVPNEPNTRRVRVQVFQYDTKELLAETVGFVTRGDADLLPHQIFNIYDISSWSDVSSFSDFPFPLSDQGELSVIKIVPTARGRDVFYEPYMLGHAESNDFQFSTQWFFRSVYVSNDAAGKSISDQYNHALRYPDEVNSVSSVPTFRLLLEKMWSQDPAYRNSVIINSGPILKLPALRNFSDAAKDPEGVPYARAVTHPERIGVPAGGQIRLRVYTYSMRPDDGEAASSLAKVTLVLDQPILPSQIHVDRLRGDAATPYEWVDNVGGPDAEVVRYSTYTVITLHDSPLRHPLAPDGSGLAASARLYGLEYIPCLVTAPPPVLPPGFRFPEGDHDLSDASPAGDAKNTARWRVRINSGGVTPGVLRVETRIGDDLTTGGLMYTMNPCNLSRTYVWVRTPVPLTEQFQFLGDPRHMPYADVKAYHGYNWFFTTVAGLGYEGFSRTNEPWSFVHTYPNTVSPNTQRINFDLPRYMQVIREALLRSNSTFVIGNSSLSRNENAPPLSYVTFGGEIRFQWTRTGTSPLRTVLKPWVPGSTFTPFDKSPGVLEISNGQDRPDVLQANLRIIAKTDNSWMSLPWLGELFPDEDYTSWKHTGNLPTDGPGNRYYRAPYSQFAGSFGLPPGTNFANQVAGAGLSTFLNGNNTGAGDNYVYNPYLPPENATYTPDWKSIEELFRFYMGNDVDQTSSRFRLDESNPGQRPPGYLQPEYQTSRTRVTVVRRFMTVANPGLYPEVVSALRVEDPTAPSRVAHVLVNGNDNRDWAYELGRSQNKVLGAWTFMESGSPLVPPAGRTQPIPRVTFQAPAQDAIIENPTLIPVAWQTAWVRWEGNAYTPDYPATFASNVPVRYKLMYMDHTNLWRDALPQGAVGNTGMQWDASGLPAGRYLLRLQAHRQFDQHFAYEDRQIEIKR